MVAFVNRESATTLVAFEPKDRKGLWLAMIPVECDAMKIQNDLHDAGIEPESVYELDRWAETANGICLAFVPLVRPSGP